VSLINFEFRNEILQYNASLSYCYQCSTCSSGCPVALITEGKYNPRKIIELALLGFEEELIEEQNPNVWLCSTCQKCLELCPQKVELTEIFSVIKNRCFERGKLPEAFVLQAQTIVNEGIAIPFSKSILSRREKMNLPEIKTAEMKELEPIFKETGIENKIKVGEK